MKLYQLTKDVVPFYSTPQATLKPAGVINKASVPPILGNPAGTVKVMAEESIGGSSKPPYKLNTVKFYLVLGYGWVQDVNLKDLKKTEDLKGDKELKEQLEDTYKNVADSMNSVFDHLKEIGIPGLDNTTVGDLVNKTLGNKDSGKLDVSTRLFGQPFQFTSETDMRITAEGEQYELGRKYTETFIGEAPICSIIPGVSSFLPNFSDEERNAVTSFFKGAGVTGSNKKHLEDMLKEESRYFDFVSSYTTYMKYVNLMCRTSAVYMGIGDTRVPINNIVNDKLQYFDWKNYKYSGLMVSEEQSSKNYSIFDLAEDVKESITLENIIKEGAEMVAGAKNYVEFYVDPASSFQETSTNQTTNSSLSGFLEQAQGYSKEYHFYKGLADGTMVDGLFTGMSAAGSVLGGAANVITDAFSGGLLTKLFGATKTVINGGNVLLPEIWGDTNYQKSYSVNVKLVSPFGTKESVYLHVLVPLFHLLALGLPRQITANGFAQPFLVKLSAKGWFSCEMGMIDSISVEKVQGSYTVNGVPTEINVSISVRDLYSDLMITSATKPGLFIANRGLMNWIAVTSGVDVTQPAFIEKWEAVMKTLLVSQTTGISDIYDQLKEKLQNILSPITYF